MSLWFIVSPGRGEEGRAGGRKNKMEQQTYPHPPKNKDEAARTSKRTIFQSLISGEWGSLTSPCIFSKIVQDSGLFQTLPQNHGHI